jgi:hypothetical protein
MQTGAPQATPAPPAPPQAPPIIEIPTPDIGQTIQLPTTTRPLTARDIQAIRERRSELSNQLQSADRRRNELVRRLGDAEGANRTGLEARLKVLDARIEQIETDIAITGRQLTSAPSHLLATSIPTVTPRLFGVLNPGQTTALGIVFTIFVLFPIAFALARRLWKRGSVAPVVPALKDNAEQMHRLEQAIDAIAIEVERISEGQRYVTRLLSEGQATPVLAAGQAAAESVPVRGFDAQRPTRDRL